MSLDSVLRRVWASTTPPPRSRETPPPANFDIDSWNVSLYPKDLLGIWNAHMTTITLMSGAPPSHKDHPFFKDWLWIGKGPGLIRIKEKFKHALFNVLKDFGLEIRHSKQEEGLIRGGQTITAGTLVTALRMIRCKSVRISGYGTKTEIAENVCAGNARHPHSRYNSFDFGKTHRFRSNDIVLTRLRRGNVNATQYVLCNPVSEGFGTVKFQRQIEGSLYKIKAYSPLVHCIKAMSGKQLARKPLTIQEAKSRLDKAQEVIDEMQKTLDTSPASFGGVRIETTVICPLLSQGRNTVERLNLCELATYTAPSEHAQSFFKFDAKSIPVSDYLANCRALLAAALPLPCFVGANKKPTDEMAQQIVVDIFNALGWNRGTFRTTKFNTSAPWWHLHAQMLEHERDRVIEERRQQERIQHVARMAQYRIDQDATWATEQVQRMQAEAAVERENDELAAALDAVDLEEPALPVVPRQPRETNMALVTGVEAMQAFFINRRERIRCVDPNCSGEPGCYITAGGNRAFKIKCRVCKKCLTQAAARAYFTLLVRDGILEPPIIDEVNHNHRETFVDTL